MEAYTYQQDPTGPGYSYDYEPAVSLSTNAIFMSDKLDNIALGNNAGLDATVNVFGKTFLTGAINNLGKPQGMLILQQRILDENPVGFSIGAVIRNYQVVGIDGVNRP